MIYLTPDDESERYDAAGKLLSITTRSGIVQQMAYDELGQLHTVTDSFGRSITFTYDALNRISTMRDPANGIYTYGYDTSANLANVTFPDGKIRNYLYEEGATLSSALTGIVDENGARYATYTYDTQGRAISTGHAGGAQRATFVYNADGSTTVTDALGTVRTYNFQSTQGVSKISGVSQPCATCGGNAAQNISYDANGNIASKTDFNGVATTYVHDLTRNLETSRTEAAGTPQQRTITTQWHPTFRLPTLITEPGKTTAYTYDSRGLLIQKTLTDTALGTSRTWNYSYNAQGLLETADGPRTDVADITSYAYDAQGNVTSITNALNQVTQITSYDAHGHPLSIVDPNGLTTTLTYSPRGWLTSRSVGGEIATYDYDGVGQLIKVTQPDNSFINFSYDAAHRLTAISDGLGNRISYTLDAMGNRIQENVYDPSNTLTQTRSRVFNALNRLAQDIGALNQTSSYSYDNNGNLASSSDPLSNTTTHSYDALNRLVQVTDPGNGITGYSYDALDRLTRVTDPRNLQTNYSYDALDNLVQVLSPDTGTTSNTYDTAGNLKTSTDARGAVTSYSYDALNRLTQISATLGAVTHTTNFQNDSGANALGRLSAVSDAGSTTSYSYDNQGRISAKTQQTGSVSLTETYTYDATGRLAQITYPSGKIISYGYDTQGRINALNAGAQSVMSNLSYPSFGAASAWTWGNGGSYNRTLDGDGRIASYTLNGYTRSLSYDPAGRLTALSDATVQSFGYDALDRLTSYTAPGANQSFSYDPVGNRTQLNDNGSLDTYSYASNSNRLSAITGAHAKSYNYSANGNIIHDGSRSYSYDPRNRMTAANGSSYTLNGLGQRIKKQGGVSGAGPGDADGDNTYSTTDRGLILEQILQTGTAPGNPDCNQDGLVNVQDLVCLNSHLASGAVPAISGTVLYAYDQQGQLIGEYDSNGNAIQETVYLGRQPVAVLKQGNVYYIHTDHLDTPRVISDTSNKAVWRWDDSDPFGTTAANDDPDMDGVTFTYNLRFPGQVYDAETGLHYNYFRDYDPGTGRYIESDPTGLLGGINTYSYVGNNPLYWIDPFGLQSVTPTVPGIPGFPIAVPPVAIPGTPENQGWVDMVTDAINGFPSFEIQCIGARCFPVPVQNKDGSESKPDNCPSGTLPIDKAKGKFGLDKDDVHKIKKGIHAGPRTWTGIDPDGNVWTGGTGGVGENHGPFDPYLPGSR